MASEPASLVERLAEAYRDEARARVALRTARAAEAEAIRRLRAEGLTLDRIAHRLGRALGHVFSVNERLRMAERLRKRLARARTNGPMDLDAAHGQTVSAGSASQGVSTPAKEIDTMARKLIRRVTTEEFIQRDDLDEAEYDEQDDSEADVEDAEDDDEAAPRRRSKGSRR